MCIFFDAPQPLHEQLGMSWQSPSILHASLDGEMPVASRVALPVAAAGFAAGPEGVALGASLSAGRAAPTLEASFAGCGVALGAAQLVTRKPEATPMVAMSVGRTSARSMPHASRWRATLACVSRRTPRTHLALVLGASLCSACGDDEASGSGGLSSSSVVGSTSATTAGPTIENDTQALVWMSDCDATTLYVYDSTFNGEPTIPEGKLECDSGSDPDIVYLEVDPRTTGEMHPMFQAP